MVFMMFSLIARDRDGKIIATHDIDSDTLLTPEDARAIARANPEVHSIERVTTVERRPS